MAIKRANERRWLRSTLSGVIAQGTAGPVLLRYELLDVSLYTTGRPRARPGSAHELLQVPNSGRWG